MKKWMKNLYAMLLVVVLITTLIPTSVLAAQGKGHGKGKDKPNKHFVETEVSETEIVEEETPVVEEEIVLPENPAEPMPIEENEQEPEVEAVSDEPAEEIVIEEVINEQQEEEEEILEYPSFSVNDIRVAGAENLLVSVEVPENAFPAGTEVFAKAASVLQAQETVNSTEGVQGTVVAAVDITFMLDGEELQPANNQAIKVSITARNLIADAETLNVVHIDNMKEEAENVEGIEINSMEETVSFDAAAFSVYALIVIGETGSVDYEQDLGGETVKVTAPENAFPAGTEMKLESVSNEETLAKVAASLDDTQIYSLYALDISFWYQGNEIEPALPVSVTWESSNIDSSDCQLVHVTNSGDVESVKNAVISAESAVFTADEFSEYVLVSTTRQSTVPISYFTFNPGTITTDVTEITSGDIQENAPVIDEYTFDKATIQLSDGEDVAVQVGAFIAKYEDSENPEDTKEEYHVFYRTAESMTASDIIVLITDQKITLNYYRTPYDVTYVVNYGGRSYTIGQDTLPDELKDLVLTGPEAVDENTSYDHAVVLSLPRGYSATVRMSNENRNQDPALGEGSEPNYSCTDGWTVTPDDYPFTINGTYTISNVTSNLTVTVNVTKRTSYRFTAQPAFNTAYFGGTSTARYQNVNPGVTYTFTGNSTEFSFTTRNSNNITWAMDSLNINKETILVPFVDSSTRTASAVTTLTSGTEITVSASYLTSGNRTYTISVSNCFENITITGGNLHNVTDKPEWVLQERENLSEFDYLGGNWNPLVAGEPMSYAGWDSAGSNNTQRWNAWRNNRINFTARVIRFKVKEGYVNPQIKYITPEGSDDYSRVGDVTLDSAAADYYHLITSEPDADGYYYFSLKGNTSSTYMGLLSAKAELARYGVNYKPGTVAAATIPEFDEGGRYGDGSLRGYNIEDNDMIAISKDVPSDPSGNYVFLNYSIEEDDSGDTYAPSQKVPLSEVAQFAKYDSSKGEYVIPFVANWVAKEEAKTVTITVNFLLDDEFERSVDVQVTQGASVYIDIDSEEMSNFMNDYNWQLFYDEIGSDPYIESATEDQSVDLHIYSKFYVYHSATDTLELHTTKEMETGSGNNRTIGTLDITALTSSGYYYGGYYKDYLGAHVGNTASGTNLVKAAADQNNDVGTLTTADIVALSNGEGVEIPEYSGATSKYNPVSNAAHLAYWTRSNAFTTLMKNSDTSWFGNRGSKDTAVLQTGGTGTAVTIARAGIYYLHEVPANYLATPKVATIKSDNGKGDITKMFLLSVADLNIFRAGGTKIVTSDKKGSFAKNFTLTKYDDGIDAVVTTETKTAQDLFSVNGYLIVTDGKDCLEDGSYELDPYWITYDNVTIHGSDVATAGHVRTITVSGNTVS